MSDLNEHVFLERELFVSTRILYLDSVAWLAHSFQIPATTCIYNSSICRRIPPFSWRPLLDLFTLAMPMLLAKMAVNVGPSAEGKFYNHPVRLVGWGAGAVLLAAAGAVLLAAAAAAKSSPHPTSRTEALSYNNK